MERNRLTVLIAGIALLAVAGVGVAAGIGTDSPASPAHDAPRNDAQPFDRSITVDAIGTAETAPDMAVIDVAVTVEGDNQSEIRDTLAEDAADLRATLDNLSVEYETTRYSIEQPPRFEERDRPPYRGVHAFEVRLDDVDRAGAVADAAVDAGAEIGGIELTLSEATRQQLRDDAIGNAMADARHQAETVAASTDLNVSGVLTVDAAQQRYEPVDYEYAAAAQEDAGSSTQVDTGDVTVSYDVTVTYSAVPEAMADGSATSETTSGSGSGSSSGSSGQ